MAPTDNCSAPLDPLLTPIVICSPGVTVPRFRTTCDSLVAAVGPGVAAAVAPVPDAAVAVLAVGLVMPTVNCSPPLAPTLTPIVICSPGVRVPRLSTTSDPLVAAVEPVVTAAVPPAPDADVPVPAPPIFTTAAGF